MKSQYKVILVDRLKSTYGTNVLCWWSNIEKLDNFLCSFICVIIRWWGGFSHKHFKSDFKLLQYLNLYGKVAVY